MASSRDIKSLREGDIHKNIMCSGKWIATRNHVLRNMGGHQQSCDLGKSVCFGKIVRQITMIGLADNNDANK